MEKKEIVFVLVISLVLFFCLFDYAPVTGFFISGSIISPKITIIDKEYDYEISEKITLDVEESEERSINVKYTGFVVIEVDEKEDFKVVDEKEDSKVVDEKEDSEVIDVLIYDPDSNLKTVSSISTNEEEKVSLGEEVKVGLWDAYFIKNADKIEGLDFILDDEGIKLIDENGNLYFERDNDIHKLTLGGLETVLGEGIISEDGVAMIFTMESELVEINYFLIENEFADIKEKIKLTEDTFKKLKLKGNPEILELALGLKDEEYNIVAKITRPLGLKSETVFLPEKYEEEKITIRKIYSEKKEEQINYEFKIGEEDYSILGISIYRGVPEFNLAI